MDNKRTYFIILFLSMFLVGTLLIFTTPSSIKVRYGLTTETKDGVTISFNVFEPDNANKNKKAIIIAHGIFVNKEMMKGYAIELAAAGFVAIPFDFRGHGQSSGELNVNLLINDVKAIKAYLASRDDIDMDNLGYIGLSMGGSPGNKIVKDDKDFKCFIGVGTRLSIDDKDCINRTLNILIILAKYDQALDLKGRKREIADRLDIDEGDVQVNKLYGSFENGDATKLYLDDNSDHFTTAYDQDFIREARDWVINTFPRVVPVDQNFFANYRALILIFQLIGGLGCFFLALDPLSNLIGKSKERGSIEFKFENQNKRDLSIKAIIYSFSLAIPGMVLMAPFFIFLPLSTFGFALTILYGQVFGIFILFWRICKNSNVSLIETFKNPLKDIKGNTINTILVAGGLATILYVILFWSLGLNYLGMFPSIYNKLIWIPLYFLVVFFMFIIHGLFFHEILQKQFMKEQKSLLKTFLVIFGIQILYLVVMVLLVCFLLGSFFFIQLLYFGIPIFLLSISISTLLYKKTGNILIAAIINTLFVTFLFSTLSPFMTGLDMITIFTN